MKKRMIFVIIILISFSLLFSAEWNMISKLSASDRTYDDYFGTDVAISGNWAIVGASGESQNISEGGAINNAGAAYFFRFNGSEWVETQKVIATHRGENYYFGRSVDLCGDYAIVGAEEEDVLGGHKEGAAYIYHFSGTDWELQDWIYADDRQYGDYFGSSVAMTESYAVVGAVYHDFGGSHLDTVSQAGAVYVFARSGESWGQVDKLFAPFRREDDNFGDVVDISGTRIVVGVPLEDMDADSMDYEMSAGAVYVFHGDGSDWALNKILLASDRNSYDQFGNSVAIDGNTIAVGAHMEDHDADGLNTEWQTGSAYIFDYNGVTWSETQKIVASERWDWDLFGSSIDIEGDVIVVGATGESHDSLAANYVAEAGAVYIFEKSGTWTETEKITEYTRREDDHFGGDISLSGDVLLVGAAGNDLDFENRDTKAGAGAAFVFSTGIGGVVEPEIMVKGNDIEIVNGDGSPSFEDHTDFGTTQINAGNIINGYYIQNTGTGALTLSAPIITGLNSGDFSLQATPSDSIPAGSSSAFSIIFSPLAVGVREATISIANNDADESPYTFAIQGTGKTPYSGGSGTELDPFLIATYDDLLELSAMTHDWDKIFVQTADIDAQATDSLDMGDHDENILTPEVAMGFSPLGDHPTGGDRQRVAFAGNYDGKGYSISNLYINRPEEQSVGFFGYTKYYLMEIRNIKLIDVDIHGGDDVGGLVGWNHATIDSCSVSGNVTSTGHAGGLVGYDQDHITACHSECVVSGYLAGGLVGYKEFGKIINSSSASTVQSPSGSAGGLVGSMYQAEIQNSRTSGSVTGYGYTGGFAGSIKYRSKITNCYARSVVTGPAPFYNKATGGFCGHVDGSGINLGSYIENCYSTSLVHYTGIADPTDRGFVGTVALTNTFLNNFFNVNTSEQHSDTSGTATPLGSTGMRNLITFTSTLSSGLDTPWDFAYQYNDDTGDDDIWDMDTSGIINDGYPFLFWENGDVIALADPDAVAIAQNDIPEKFALLPAYPNPFNPRTTISFQLSAISNVEINIFDINGRQITKLYNGNQEAGTYELIWNAGDMPSGVYIVKMVAGSFTGSQKVVLIK